MAGSSNGMEGTAIISALTPSLSISLKRTDEIEWTAQIADLIRLLEEDPQSYVNEASQLSRLRSECRGAGPNEAGRSLVYCYYAQLEKLGMRFDTDALTIAFSWHDAFAPKLDARQSSIAFEKANILFNLGAIYSQLASTTASEKENRAEALKNAAHGYQAAASVFRYVSENFLHPPLADLSQSAQIILSTLMLAQAQECVVQRAILDSRPANILAKLQAATSSLYEQASTRLSSVDAGSFRGTLDKGWVAMLEGKTKYAQVLADFYAAQACYAKEAHGECLARYSRITRVCGDMLKLGSLSESMKAVFKILEGHVATHHATVEHENSLLFHQVVPLPETLSTVDPTQLVKEIPFIEIANELGSTVETDIFRRLIPMQVLQEQSRYSEEKAKLLRYECSKVDAANQAVEMVKNKLNLPKALEELCEQNTDLPRDLKVLRQEVASVGSYENIAATLHSQLDGVNAAIRNSMQTLAAEAQHYQKGQIKYGDQWEQVSAHEETNQIYNEIENINSSLEGLQRASMILGQSFEPIKAEIELLRGPESALTALFPQRDLLATNPEELDATKLKLADADAGIRQRQLLVDQLRSELLADDISSLLIGRKGDFEQLFDKELQKYDGLCSQIEESVHTSSATCDEITRLWTLAQSKAHDSRAELKKSETLEKFTRAVQLYHNILESMRKTLVNSKDIQDQAGRLEEKTFAFHGARDKERKELESRLGLDEAQKGQQLLLDRLRALDRKPSSGKPGDCAQPFELRSSRAAPVGGAPDGFISHQQKHSSTAAGPEAPSQPSHGSYPLDALQPSITPKKNGTSESSLLD